MYTYIPTHSAYECLLVIIVPSQIEFNEQLTADGHDYKVRGHEA